MLLKHKEIGSSTSTTPTRSPTVSTTEISTISTTSVTGMKMIQCSLEVKCIISQLHYCYLLSFPTNCLSGQSILKCYGSFFSETLCPWPTFIQIQSADYGRTTSSDATNCNPDEKLCWQEVQEVTPSYYQTILNACNGNRACVNLMADWAQMPECSNILSDYVEIFYNCIPNS